MTRKKGARVINLITLCNLDKPKVNTSHKWPESNVPAVLFYCSQNCP